MQGSTCSSCRLLSRSRFHRRLIELQNGRRKFLSSRAHEEAQPQPQPQSPPRTPESWSWYWQTSPPTRQNLAAASHFFKHNTPTRIWTGEGWRNRQNESQELPEVIFLGRSNVGKSSVINALTSSDINRVSSVPGATKAMAAWTLAARTSEGGAIRGWDGDVSPKLTLVDMPGYGHGSQTEWGNAIVEYLGKRRNIRRAFVLIDVLHGVMGRDLDILKILLSHAIPYQIVATKCDRFALSKYGQTEAVSALTHIRTNTHLDEPDSLGLGEIIATGFLQDMKAKDASRIVTKRAAFGVPNLQWAVLRAAGLDKYAMQKAESHGILKKLPAEEQRAFPIQEGSVHEVVGQELADSGHEDVGQNGSGRDDLDPNPSEPESLEATASSASPSAAANETGVSVEDFLREILNATPQKTPDRQANTQQQREGAKIFPSLAPDEEPTSTRKRSGSPGSLLSDWLAEAESSQDSRKPPYTGAQRHKDLFSNRLDASHSRSSSIRSSTLMWSDDLPESRTAQTTTTKESKGGHHHRDHQFPFSTSRKHQSQSNSSRSRVSRGFDALVAQSSPSPPVMASSTNRSQQSQPAVPGKGVMRGMDALEAMSALDPRAPKSNPKSHSKSKSNSRFSQGHKSKSNRQSTGSAGSNSHRGSESKQHTQQQPPLAGKGVTRGLDALEAMLGSSGPAKRGRRK